MRPLHYFGLSAFALLLFVRPVAAQSGYTITDLGSLYGASYANDINNSGQVAGEYNTATAYSSFLYSGGHLTDLGNPGVTNRPDLNTSEANGINDSGQIVGQYSYTTQDPSGLKTGTKGGFLYQNGQIQAIGLYNPRAINNAGQIVGQDKNNNPALYQNGAATLLTLPFTDPNTTTNAHDINNSGIIVGDTVSSGNLRAFYYQNGVEHLLPQISAPFPGSIAQAINDTSDIVGTARFGNDYEHAALWKNGQVFDLGSFGEGSIAYDINNNGVIVGEVFEANSEFGAFVYRDGQMSDLLTGTGWHNGYATSINDNGQIVGFAVSPNGYSHAFLATPNAVPAPGSLLTFGMGIGVMLLAARRRRRNAAPR